ncbi:MAG: D-tyrosyl-tRNA(Tyr) deacylase [Bdellovibrionales bacterium]|nr:D-tyrosyl-tRNA(Tyr) deacylase [Bdellovibrionales bacterium]
MKIVIQRVNSASVKVNNKTVGSCGQGLLLLVGFGKEDTNDKLSKAAQKILNMRIFSDDSGKFNYSLLDINGEILCVSQFTLYADTRKGNRPGFSESMEPEKASELFNLFVSELKELGANKVETGQFGAYMQVELVNDGPVTIQIDI